MFWKIILKLIELTIAFISYLRRACTSKSTSIFLTHQTPTQIEAQKLLANKTHNIPVNINKTSLLIIIPFRDKWKLTQKCLASLLEQSITTLQITIVLVDNGSTQSETLNGIKSLENLTLSKFFKIEYMALNIPFNFSTLNNMAVQAFSYLQPDWLLFLNNDVELTEPNTLQAWLTQADELPNCGAVGCSLVYPDKKIQHLFLAPGVKLLAAHPGKGFSLNLTEQWYKYPRAVGAVTGAAMLIRRAEFMQHGCFDENLPSTGQDLDLCLKLQSAGKINWVISQIVMIHHETATRSFTHNFKELAFLHGKYGSYLWNNKYYSEIFSRWSENPILTMGEGRYPWYLLFKNYMSHVKTSQVNKITEIKSLRKKTFQAQLPLNKKIQQIALATPGYAFLANPAGQNVYLYLTNFVKTVAEQWFQKQFNQLNILDWGCGKGHVAYLLEQLGGNLCYCDVVNNSSDSAFGAQATPLLNLLKSAVKPLAHAYRLPYDDNSLDVVLSFGVLEHVPNDAESLLEIKRVLRPNGLFFCFDLPYICSYTQRLAHLRGDNYHDRLYSWGRVCELLSFCDLHLVDAWHRQLFPKNSIKYPSYHAFEQLDQLLTEYTPLKHFATNIEFIAVKE